MFSLGYGEDDDKEGDVLTVPLGSGRLVSAVDEASLLLLLLLLMVVVVVGCCFVYFGLLLLLLLLLWLLPWLLLPWYLKFGFRVPSLCTCSALVRQGRHRFCRRWSGDSVVHFSLKLGDTTISASSRGSRKTNWPYSPSSTNPALLSLVSLRAILLPLASRLSPPKNRPHSSSRAGLYVVVNNRPPLQTIAAQRYVHPFVT